MRNVWLRWYPQANHFGSAELAKNHLDISDTFKHNSIKMVFYNALNIC